MSQPHRILVIANRTCACEALQDEIAARADGRGSEVLIVAPALNGRLRHLATDDERAIVQARERVAETVERLRGRGVDVRGEVGDARPFQAIQDALGEFEADELVISTWPHGRSHWLEKGLLEDVRREISIPWRHITSHYGLVTA